MRDLRKLFCLGVNKGMAKAVGLYAKNKFDRIPERDRGKSEENKLSIICIDIFHINMYI